jgi:Mn2+/Fe2+ NRAMP family transporter
MTCVTCVQSQCCHRDVAWSKATPCVQIVLHTSAQTNAFSPRRHACRWQGDQMARIFAIWAIVYLGYYSGKLCTYCQCCQIVYFHTKNPKYRGHWNGKCWYAHFMIVHFVVIWLFGKFFPRFGVFNQEKSGNPAYCKYLA